jgi:hypothetical protein
MVRTRKKENLIPTLGRQSWCTPEVNTAYIGPNYAT